MTNTKSGKNDFYANLKPAVLSKATFLRIRENVPQTAPLTAATPSNYLFCMPYTLGHFYLCLQIFLPFIKEHPGQVKLIVHQSIYPLLKHLDYKAVFPLYLTELDENQFPTDSTILALLTQPFKVAVDFNYPAYATTTYIAAQAQAQYRIGLQSPFAEELYNVVINFVGEHNLERSYQRIKQLLVTQFAWKKSKILLDDARFRDYI